jgi:hypothetical protein
MVGLWLLLRSASGAMVDDAQIDAALAEYARARRTRSRCRRANERARLVEGKVLKQRLKNDEATSRSECS